MLSKRKNIASFTVMELLAVIGIISILASFLLPVFSAARAKARYAKWQVYSKNIINDPNLVAYYDFQEGGGTVLTNQAIYPWDKVPATADGTLTGSPAWTEGRWPGKWGLDFSAGSNHVNINGARPFVATSSGGTIMAWCYPTEAGASNRYVVNSVMHGRTYLQFTSNELRTVKGDPADSARNDVDINTWYHVAVTWELDSADSSNCTSDGYLNGAIMDINGAGTFTNTQVGSHLYIGQSGSSTQNFPGIIDEVMIFDRALTASEIATHYDAGKP